jgi:hypothetical protein
VNNNKPYYKPAGHPAVRPIMASLHNRPGWMMVKYEDIGHINPLTDKDLPRLMDMFRSIAKVPLVGLP